MKTLSSRPIKDHIQAQINNCIRESAQHMTALELCMDPLNAMELSREAYRHDERRRALAQVLCWIQDMENR